VKRAPSYRKAPSSRVPLLTRKEAAKMFGVSVSLLEKVASRNEGLPYYESGMRKARTLYRLEDIETFFRARFGDEYVQSMQSFNFT
jgi:hypothetical protein